MVSHFPLPLSLEVTRPPFQRNFLVSLAIFRDFWLPNCGAVAPRLSSCGCLVALTLSGCLTVAVFPSLGYFWMFSCLTVAAELLACQTMALSLFLPFSPYFGCLTVVLSSCLTVSPVCRPYFPASRSLLLCAFRFLVRNG